MALETRIGVIAILVSDHRETVPKVNALLTEYGRIIMGRMGIPYREKAVSVISIIVEGTTDDVGSLTGQLGMIPGVRTKSLLLTK